MLISQLNCMNKLLLLIFLLISIQDYAQSLSKTSIIYERKNQVVMNNGKHYQILVDKPFYEIADNTIKRYIHVGDHTLMLNRVLVIRNDNEYNELIEWIKEDLRFYESREIINFTTIDNYILEPNKPLTKG